MLVLSLADGPGRPLRADTASVRAQGDARPCAAVLSFAGIRSACPTRLRGARWHTVTARQPRAHGKGQPDRTAGPGAKRAGRGQAASRDKWPESGPVRDWLAYCDQVRQDNGTPSLRTLQERMHLAFARVGELLRSELPVDEEQARALLRERLI